MVSVVHDVIYSLLAILMAGFVSFLLTPLVRVLAFKLKAIDIPKDERRMHKKPTPLIGGVSIFVAFSMTVLLFCFDQLDAKIFGMLAGGLLIVIIGIVDDIYKISPWVKLAGQIVASLVPIAFGIRIERIYLMGEYHNFNYLEIPVTLLWIVGLTNAINLVDGLDGLACGISTISACSMMVFALLEVDFFIATMLGILVGSCLGFLPYNRHPASIFMGDTGALFLGYTLSVISILGVFKVNAFVSFLTPFLIFGLPLLDTLTAMIRRIAHGQSPFHADRGHFHHKLIDLGFNQKQAVTILYSISAIFGISAVLFTEERLISAVLIIIITFIIGYLNFRMLVGSKQVREQLGLRLKAINTDKEEKNEDTSTENTDKQ